MKFNFRKIASTAASTVLIGSTVALAAAASYPAPFANGGVADVGIVYGSNAASSDLVAATDVRINLENALRSQGAGSSGTPTGGDFVLLDKNNDHLNLGNSWSGTFGTTVDSEDLETVLADGEYVANDNDEFSYEQSITLGAPVLSFFRDSDYEDMAGLDEKTPVIGFNITDGEFIMNYTLDFLDQPQSDVASGDLQDFEGSDLPILGKNFYVSDAKNISSSTDTNQGKFTLLDSANTATVKEGETITLNAGGTTYEVSIDFIDTDSVVLVVNGEESDDLTEGSTQKLSDGSYLGIRDVRARDVAGTIGSVEFSIGSGKIEITSGSDVKINDETVDGVKAWIRRGTSSGDVETLDSISIEWKADDDMFLTPDTEIVMPGFGAVKFTMNDLIRSEEEKITLTNDGDDSIVLEAPVKDGMAEVNLLYANATGDFTVIGKDTDARLLTVAPTAATAIFKKKLNSVDYHEKVVFSYNSSDDAQSYVLSFTTNEDSSAGRNETTVKNEVTGESWSDRKTGDVFNLGDVQFTISTIWDNSTDEWVELNWTIANGMSIDRLFTPGGLMIQLPYASANETTTAKGNVWLGSGTTNHTDGYNYDKFYLFMRGEDKDDNLFSGTWFNLSVDDNTDNELEVSEVNNAGTGGPRGLEIGSTNTYENYVKDDVAPRLMHYTNGDQDYVEVYYPMGESETYAEVFLAETGTSSGSGGVDLGSIVVYDSEVSQVSAKNLVVVGGSCINSVASTLLGGAGCGSSFESASGVGAGEFLIQTFASPFSGAKVATLVAGYNAADTTNAASYLTNNAVDTTVGKKYIGTDADTAQLV